jgi:hypothetical protein
VNVQDMQKTPGEDAFQGFNDVMTSEEELICHFVSFLATLTKIAV